MLLRCVVLRVVVVLSEYGSGSRVYHRHSSVGVGAASAVRLELLRCLYRNGWSRPRYRPCVASLHGLFW